VLDELGLDALDDEDDDGAEDSGSVADVTPTGAVSFFRHDAATHAAIAPSAVRRRMRS
jgi:hypothetical protein